MHINQLKESRFLKKEDCGPGILVTVKGLTQENLALEGQPVEMKWCLHFNETAKPLILNTTNAQLIGQFLGEETDAWTGHKVVLYHNPSISYAGKLVGGITARAPRGPSQPSVAPRPLPTVLPPQPVGPPDMGAGFSGEPEDPGF